MKHSLFYKLSQEIVHNNEIDSIDLHNLCGYDVGESAAIQEEIAKCPGIRTKFILHARQADEFGLNLSLDCINIPYSGIVA